MITGSPMLATPLHRAPTTVSADSLLLTGSRHRLAQVVAAALRTAGVATDAQDPPRIVLAVSGGGDSMAMLVLVAALRARVHDGLARTAVVSIDHGLREGAHAEAESAVALARHLGVGWAEVRSVSVARSGNVLDAARTARFTALRSVCAEFKASTILLAQQAEDRAESLLIGLARGIGIESLAALMPMRVLEDHIAVVRPMLGCRRSELREFLRDAGVSWSEDPSNTLRDRGALRTDPTAVALVDRVVAGCGPLFAEAAALLDLRDTLASRAIGDVDAGGIDRASLEALHPIVRAEVLARLCSRAGSVARRSMIARVEQLVEEGDRAPHRFMLEGDCVLVVDRARVAIESPRAPAVDRPQRRLSPAD
jgi:tRNA(Ile)-lysidine synthetase-like protein